MENWIVCVSLFMILLHAKWLLFVLYPFMVIDGHNRNRSFVGKLLASPYLVCERIARGGGNSILYLVGWLYPFYSYS